MKIPEPEVLEYRREMIARLTREGRSATEIAARLRISVRTVYRYRQITGASRNRCSPMSEDELAIARMLLEDGASYGEVGRTLGRRGFTISRRFPGRGWGVGAGGEYRRAMQQLDALRPVS